MIRLEAVRKRNGGRGDVLAGVGLDVEPGRPVVVLGANGSGKSTLLRIVAGAASPTSGRVTGRPDGLGYLPPHAHTTSRMTAGAWLAHRLRMRGAPDADPRPVLDALGADPGALGAPLRALSTGNLRKVALAAALAGPPPLAVLDEPWNGLDVAAAPALTRLLVDLAPSVALLVADHSGHAATLRSLRALRLDRGLLVPARLAPRPAVTAVVLRPGAGSSSDGAAGSSSDGGAGSSSVGVDSCSDGAVGLCSDGGVGSSSDGGAGSSSVGGAGDTASDGPAVLGLRRAPSPRPAAGTGGAPGALDPALLPDLPSVLSREVHDGLLVVRVAAGDVDTLLAAALARGLSVVRVEPEDGP